MSRITSSLVWGKSTWAVFSPHEWPVMGKASLYHDVIIFIWHFLIFYEDTIITAEFIISIKFEFAFKYIEFRTHQKTLYIP